jgi:Flp pilus assembly protein TadD
LSSTPFEYPGNAPWYERGLLRGAKGDLDGALADYAKVIELDPRYAKAYANRGMIKLLRRQDADAQTDLDKAFELDDTLRPILQKRIDEIMKARQPPPSAVQLQRREP